MSYYPTQSQREAEAWYATQQATSNTPLRHAMRVLVFLTGAQQPDSLARYRLKGGYPHPDLVAVVRTCLDEIDRLIGGAEQRWLRPERHGLPWSQCEDAALTHAFDDGFELLILARQLERSEVAILYRLEQMGRIKAPDEDAFLFAQIDMLLAEKPDSVPKMGLTEVEGDKMPSSPTPARDSPRPVTGRSVEQIQAHPLRVAPNESAVAGVCSERPGCLEEIGVALSNNEINGHRSEHPTTHRSQAVSWPRVLVGTAYPKRVHRDNCGPGVASDPTQTAGVAR